MPDGHLVAKPEDFEPSEPHGVTGAIKNGLFIYGEILNSFRKFRNLSIFRLFGVAATRDGNFVRRCC